MSHTPGPWVITGTTRNHTIVVGPPTPVDPVARVPLQQESRGGAIVQRANARLIAAAPDMLAIIEAIWNDEEMSSNVTFEVMDRMEAILKATGHLPS
jgi:hypothetical protein